MQNKTNLPKIMEKIEYKIKEYLKIIEEKKQIRT